MSSKDRPRLCRVAGRSAWHVYHQRRRLSTGCTDRASAETVLARYLAELDRPTAAQVISVSAILDRYLADRRDAGVPGAERLAWAHKALKRYWRERPPETVTDVECRAYLRHRGGERSGPHDKVAGQGTVRTELQALRAALNWAQRQGLIVKAPYVQIPGKPPPRERWLTRAEAARLVKAARGAHVRLFIHLALHTAGRAGAILALTWDRVDLERRLIDLRDPSKPETRKRRAVVPINDTLLAILQEAQKFSTTEYVIEFGGGPVVSVKHGFHAAAWRAQLPGVTPHTLRHTAATWMAQTGVPMWQIAGFLGHSSPQMVAETYGHHHPDHLQEAARALG
jgi:integrase